MIKTGIIFIENYIAGGADQVARHLINNLPFKRLTVFVNSRNDVSVLLVGSLPSHVKVEFYGLLTIAEMSAWVNAIEIPLVRSLARILGFILRYPLAFFSILYFWVRLRNVRADIFLANNGGYPGGFYCRTATLAASLLPSTRVFHVVHNMAEPARGLSRFFEWGIDYLINKSSQIITVSRATAVCLSRVRNLSQSATVIYNGVPDFPPSFLEASLILRVLNIGYLGPVKNQMMLIEALGELRRRGEVGIEVRFVGADMGDGYKALCQSRADELGVAAQIQFSGFLTEMESCYEHADVLVMCSRVEGFPMSILEAMRAAKPVVSTDVGGVKEQIEDLVTGFIVPSGDVLTLVEKLELLKSNPEMRNSFGCAARARYESSFTVSRMTSEYTKILGLN